MNKVILLGHLGKDCEVRSTQSGVAVGTFSMATARRWKDKASDEWKEETDWHNVVFWRCENVAPHLTKGTQVYVEGSMRTRSWDDKEGLKHWITEVVVDELVLCGVPRGDRAPRSSDAPEPTDGDVPF